MNSFFTNAEAGILVRLLIAHCLSDFFLQPTAWVNHKKYKGWHSKYLYYHVLVTGGLAWLLLWNLSDWWAVLIITVSHLFIDICKIKVEKNNNPIKPSAITLFFADQALHIAVIFTVWLLMIDGWESWPQLMETIFSYELLLRLLGYIIVTTPVGFIIHFITRKWTKELPMHDSLQDAGKWIGIFERILIITMVYLNQFSAIGFIVAAKSFLRVADKPDKPIGEPTMGRPFSTRKHTEYILIGTFLSVGIALITGLIINYFTSLE